MKPKYIYMVILAFVSLLAILTYLFIEKKFFTGEEINSAIIGNYTSFVSIIISLTSLTFSFVLLNVAIKAAKNFDVKKQYQHKQLQTVCDLIKEISDVQFEVLFYNREKDFNKPVYVAKRRLYSFSSQSIDLKIEKIYVLSNSIENVMPFFKFYYSPLLPKAIGNKLRAFWSPIELFKPKEIEFPARFMIFKPLEIKEDDISKDWLYEYESNFKNFVYKIEQLRSAIKIWLDDYGITDSNI